MAELIDRQAAVDAIKGIDDVVGCEHIAEALSDAINAVIKIPSAQIENTVNLCDTCAHTYPGCPSKDVIFGNGTGNDNICACGEYRVKGWVSVEERLPDTKDEYLVSVDEHGEFVSTDYFVDGGWWTYGTAVAAWMPFPEPYRG